MSHVSLSRPQPKNRINKIHFMWGKNTIRKFFFSKWIFLLQRFKNEEKKCCGFRINLCVGMHLPRNTIPIAAAFSRGNEIVAYVVPLSAAKPESSDCAGDIARSPNGKKYATNFI